MSCSAVSSRSSPVGAASRTTNRPRTMSIRRAAASRTSSEPDRPNHSFAVAPSFPLGRTASKRRSSPSVSITVTIATAAIPGQRAGSAATIGRTRFSSRQPWEPMAVTVPAELPTVTGLLLARAGSPDPGLRFEDRRWSWREHVGECARYAAALRTRRNAGQHGADRHGPGRPFHVGVLADNVPEFSFLLGGCAFAGAVLVPLNGLELPAHAPLEVAPATPEDLLMLIFTSGTSGDMAVYGLIPQDLGHPWTAV